MSTATTATATAIAATAATAATPAFKKATMTTKERAALKRELFDKEIEDYHASLGKMTPRAFNAQKQELKTRIDQEITTYTECKTIYDNLMKTAKPFKLSLIHISEPTRPY